MLTLDKIYKAKYALKNVVRRTDVIPAPKINPEADIWLKTENLQHTGSFKIRGAYYKMLNLSEEEKSRGVIACSAGNHAQGVALAAQRSGIPAVICLPDGAPISKVEATRSYGADVVLVEGVYDDAYKRALELRDEKGYTFIHPFDDIDVIAGQGTIGLELSEQIEDLDAVIVPIGGGGLISGVAFALKSLNPDIKVYGVQAAGAASMVESLDQGEVCSLESVRSIADGIAVKCPGENTFSIISEYVDDVVTVTDDEIAAEILALMESQKLVTEGAGAAAAAAAMFNKVPIKGKKVACILSGGNIDVTILSRFIDRGLLMSGRMASLDIALMDKPGQLLKVSKIIAENGGNVINVHHEHAPTGSDVNSCFLHVQMETRDHHHVQAIRDGLEHAGFELLERVQ